MFELYKTPPSHSPLPISILVPTLSRSIRLKDFVSSLVRVNAQEVTVSVFGMISGTPSWNLMSKSVKLSTAQASTHELLDLLN